MIESSLTPLSKLDSVVDLVVLLCLWNKYIIHSTGKEVEETNFAHEPVLIFPPSATQEQDSVKSNIVLSLLGQQQQFHFAFGQRPFPFAASDPLSGFRMPPIGNCNSEYRQQD